ncbi:exodeoxyribonuclease VII small subunit [bacterium]|jgi:exodeoxyribonuclease VII small subunit|nr:exodeoxyribonuclease VII small subunit [bacterium]MBT4249496.1 exodeoxyribonuclease VII small subunit [bacterium]MBT6017711.1 exodeoxyribonuclease VII small subunit [bacterium]
MAKPKKTKSFENIFEDLEKIVGKMDEGDIHLEKSLELFEKGMSLVEEGKSKLDEAELKIKTLTKNSNLA